MCSKGASIQHCHQHRHQHRRQHVASSRRFWLHRLIPPPQAEHQRQARGRAEVFQHVLSRSRRAVVALVPPFFPDGLLMPFSNNCRVDKGPFEEDGSLSKPSCPLKTLSKEGKGSLKGNQKKAFQFGGPPMLRQPVPFPQWRVLSDAESEASPIKRHPPIGEPLI